MTSTTASVGSPQANRVENALWYGLAALAVLALAGFVVLVTLMVKGAGIERIPLVDAPPAAVAPAPGDALPGQEPVPGPAAPPAPAGPGAAGVPAPSGPAVRPPAPAPSAPAARPPAPAPTGAPR